MTMLDEVVYWQGRAAARKTGYIDGRERRAAHHEYPAGGPEEDAYLEGYAEGTAVPTLLNADGTRSIFDDVDL